jgi:hypothetical protein
MSSDKYPWVKVNKRDYEKFSRRLGKSKKKILGSPLTMFLILVIGLPLLVYILMVLRDIFGHTIVVVIMLAAATAIFGTKAYQGIIKRCVRIVPKSRVRYRDEAGYIGGKTREAATGAEAVIAGIIFFVLGLVSLRLTVKFLVLMIEAFI